VLCSAHWRPDRLRPKGVPLGARRALGNTVHICIGKRRNSTCFCPGDYANSTAGRSRPLLRVDCAPCCNLPTTGAAGAAIVTTAALRAEPALEWIRVVVASAAGSHSPSGVMPSLAGRFPSIRATWNSPAFTRHYTTSIKPTVRLWCNNPTSVLPPTIPNSNSQALHRFTP